MKYTGISCPVCSEKFTDNDDIVVCPICGTPHHRHCWQEQKGCVNEEKHSDGFIWQTLEVAPAQPKFDGYQPLSQDNSNFKICPRCGTKNSVFEPVCTNCGERLKANSQTIEDQMPFNQQPFQGYGENQNPNNFSPYQNVYAADARTIYGESATIEDIQVTEIAEYVQKDSTKYIGKFLHMQEKKTKLSWNWSAGIFSVLWCFYRKMMVPGIVILLLFAASSVFSSSIPAYIYEKNQPEVYADYEQTYNDLTQEMNNILTSGSTDTAQYYALFEKLLTSPVSVSMYVMLISLWLIISVCFGFFGNYFYKRKIVKDIQALRQIAVDNMSYHMYLKQRGGVSPANVLIPIICYMIFNMLSGSF